MVDGSIEHVAAVQDAIYADAPVQVGDLTIDGLTVTLPGIDPVRFDTPGDLVRWVASLEDDDGLSD